MSVARLTSDAVCVRAPSYNETRLKNHIIDPYRGCRKIPQQVRDRIRNAHQQQAPPVHAAPLTVVAPAAVLPPAKRKREPDDPPALALVEPDVAAPPGAAVQLKVSVEFSVAAGGLLRAQWIVAEMIQEFHREVVVVSLVPSANDNVFNIWIGGKCVWSRGPGQPLPDFEHLRPLVRAHVVC